jgi:hypothetical protein
MSKKTRNFIFSCNYNMLNQFMWFFLIIKFPRERKSTFLFVIEQVSHVKESKDVK